MRSLRRREFVDAADLLWRLRAVKPPWDLDCAATSRAGSRRTPTRRRSRRRAAVSRSATSCSDSRSSRCAVAAGRSGASSRPGPGNYDTVLGMAPTEFSRRATWSGWTADAPSTGSGRTSGAAGVIGAASAEQRDLQRLIHEITMEGVAMLRPGRATPRGGCPRQRPCGRNRHAGDVAHLIDRRPRRPRDGVRHHRATARVRGRRRRSSSPAW